MKQYLAFLRSINVRGKRIIRMAELQKMIASIEDFSDVRTYIQSGNVSFETLDSTTGSLETLIEEHLQGVLGYPLVVMVRNRETVLEQLEGNPFEGLPDGPDIKHYACYLKEAPRMNTALPLPDDKEKLEFIRLTGKEAFILSQRKPGGGFGFPNGYVEKVLGVTSTARNWNTIEKFIAYLRKTDNHNAH